MLDRVKAFFKDLPRAGGSIKGDDPRVAAAALMYHVMDADGVRQDAEWDRIKQILAETYQITGRELDDLVKAGEKADQESIDLYAFTSVLNRHLDEEGRIAFIRLMWDVVYADGVLHELEDNTLWRVADLIGVDARERVLARQAAARNAPGAKGTPSNE
ncbi:TerB family tellurite resistance protein [Mesorhizobium sp. LHD-90]|uniref:tellurite resistance TerB family protein n=1 Tax=Mesorhizobium sp. LHD-90 TaxID=3071414 RepID=UPI0027DF5D45|nr:TerB family tellurite resistance protein [Mesorhizobium sp. LHD-90]MDQ6437779.1 TerB family tellurite resistance protein [Mesorhizobium sp. LHD-90]